MELTALLTKLKMEYLEAQLETVCEQAAKRELDYQSFLSEALTVEWQGRAQRGQETPSAPGSFSLAQDPRAV